MSVCGHLGFYNTSSTRTHVRLQFATFAASGSSVAPNSAYEAADIRIYRAADGAAFSNTQRSSANGITMTSPFDSLVGFHDVDIDLTDNTDAGFYAAGYFYSVVLAADETIDSQTINGIVLCTFEIGVAPVNVTQFGGAAGTFSGGRPEVNTTHAAGTAWGSGAITEGSIASDAITAAKIANGAIDAATFAADVDAEILSYIVDDATRVDASALNTLSSHDPGETIMGATDLGTGAGLTSLASAANLSALSTTVGVAGAGLTEAGGDGDHLTAINLPNQTMDIVGNITGNLSGSVGSVTGAVGSVTGNVGGNVTGSVGSVTGAVGSVTGNVGGNVTGSVGSLATQAKADVNAEVLDVLATDTFAEPSAVPAATSSLKDKINWVFSLLRNKRTQTATTETLLRDDGSTTTATSTKSDDGTTLTRGEWT